MWCATPLGIYRAMTAKLGASSARPAPSTPKESAAPSGEFSATEGRHYDVSSNNRSRPIAAFRRELPEEHPPVRKRVRPVMRRAVARAPSIVRT